MEQRVLDELRRQILNNVKDKKVKVTGYIEEGWEFICRKVDGSDIFWHFCNPSKRLSAGFGYSVVYECLGNPNVYLWKPEYEYKGGSNV